MKINFKRYIIYLIRWQLSTPLLAFCVMLFAAYGTTMATIIANFVGGLIFFWIDRYIFSSQKLDAKWQIKEKIICFDCGKVSRGYRLIHAKNYDRRHDIHPQFRCEACSEKKVEELKNNGIKI